MDDVARVEYPAILSGLQPSQAVSLVNDRVKRISRINLEIADWLQERRRVEEQYVMSLRKLSTFRVPNAQTELGVFTHPWTKIVEAVDNIAVAHHSFADRIERDVENPLRTFQQRKDFVQISNVSSNLASMARDLEDARNQSDKLSKKGGKANTQKVGAASSRLQDATQQWESQAPFILETLQAFDESRINNLRDLLTQYGTHESDQAQRVQQVSEATLAQMLEISTEKEIQDFARKNSSGRPRLQQRTTSLRQDSQLGAPSPSALSAAPASAGVPPGTAGSNTGTLAPTQTTGDDAASEHNSVPSEAKPESKLRRLGTMFGGRRRQSIHGGFGQLTPQKTPSFGRNARHVSPRASASNLRETNRMSILPETPIQQEPPPKNAIEGQHDGTNGVGGANFNLMDAPALIPTSTGEVNGHHATPDVSDVGPPPGPPPSQAQTATKDAEGYSVPAPMNDPISEAQKEAAGEDADQLFKLNIQNKPVDEEDPQEKQAALSSVANSLKMGPATRRSGTIRGRRDVRNTIYVPSPSATESPSQGEGYLPSIPASPPKTQRPAALATLTSDASIAATSDSQSVRSGHSLGNFAHVKHPDITDPGLNASIIETVSVTFQEGNVTSAAVAGEIAFVNNASDFAPKTQEVIKINNFPNLEKIGPNRIFVHNASPDQPDQYTLDTSHIQKMATAFSYRVFAEETETPSMAKFAPLLLKPAWKPQGDKLGLLLQYSLNPGFKATGPVTLHNVVFVATYDGKASGAQTKPSGTHLKDRHMVYWRLGDVTLSSEVQKIVCRIIGAEGAEPTPGHIEARWEYTSSGSMEGLASGISISRKEEGKGKGVSSDPFADDEAVEWVDVPIAAKLVSGKYEGK